MTSPLTPLSLHILLSLSAAPLHGYGILKSIEDRTEGGEAPSTGALYLALQRLEGEGQIQPAGEPPADADRRRRYWEITPAGLDAVRQELARMEAILTDEAARAVRGTAG